MSGEDRVRQIESADAIREVLGAESDIRRKVAACREDIAAALAAEQERARAIEQRTGERLSRLHAHCERQIEARTSTLRARAGSEAPPAQLDEDDRDRLRAAAERLSARLTGAVDG